MGANATAPAMDFGHLVTLVHKHLSSFYRRRVEALDKLELKKVLVRKNPYLFRAVGVHDVGELIQNLLLAYSSSSDETIFGNEFFEKAGCVGGDENLFCAVSVGFYKAACA